MLLLKVSLAVVRSRERLATSWKVTGEGTLPVDGIDVTAEILVQAKFFGIGAAWDIALEGALVVLGVFTQDNISYTLGQSRSKLTLDRTGAETLWSRNCT